MNLLATLRPPTRDERSLAYRDRIPPPPDMLASLVTPRETAIEFSEGEIRIFDKRTIVQKDTERAVHDEAVRALETLQLATGWYVFGPLADGFEPEGDCRACSMERFAWQDDDEPCPACGEAPDDDGAHVSDAAPSPAKTSAKSAESEANSAFAETIVDALLQNEWIELVTSSSRKTLVRDVVEFLVRHPECRQPAGAAPVEAVTSARPRVDAPAGALRAPSSRELAAMSPAARAAALADVAARAPAAVAARAARDALVAAAPKGNPGFDFLDYLTDLTYVAEVYADEDALAALLRGTAALEA